LGKKKNIKTILPPHLQQLLSFPSIPCVTKDYQGQNLLSIISTHNKSRYVSHIKFEE